MAGRDRRGEDRGDRNTRTRTYDDDEEEQHVYCFVPGEGIDVVVLAAYLKRWIDGTATIQPSRHPTVCIITLDEATTGAYSDRTPHASDIPSAPRAR